MQWDSSIYSGFSTDQSWLPVNWDFKQKNINIQEKDDLSLLSFYRSLIWLRKKTKALSIGEIHFITNNPDKVLVYKRTYETEEVVIILNFSNKSQYYPMKIKHEYSILLGTHQREEEKVERGNLKIYPYEVLILK